MPVQAASSAGLRSTDHTSAPAVFVARWLARPESLLRQLPPWVPLRGLTVEPRDDGGTTVSVGLDHRHLGPATTFVHQVDDDGRRMVLTIEAGTTYRQWRLVTEVFDDTDGEGDGCRIEQTLESDPLHQREFAQWLAARGQRIARDTRLLAELPPPGDQPLTVAIGGASGMVGTDISYFLRAAGHRVRPMVRRAARTPDEIEWDPGAGRLDADAFADVDIVIALSGENIAGGRWTDARKKRLRDSRIDTLNLIARTIAAMPEATRPRALLATSGISIYGDCGDTELTEDSPTATSDFLASLAIDWEAAADPARDAGVRTVHMRLAPVISAAGGPLPKLLTPFRLGLGGRVGSGRQYWTWVAADDVLGVFWRAMVDDRLTGPVNLAAPQPLTNRDYTKALGRAISRPTMFPLPAFVVSLMLGEMGRTALLGSQRAIPQRLLDLGHRFDLPDLETAIRFAIGRIKL